jgi:UDP-galactose transporter
MPFILVATLLMTLQPVLVKLSQVNGKAEYSYISTTLLSESTKIAISIGMYYKNEGMKWPTIHYGELLTYSIPAIVYFINNNLVFVILEYIDSTSFQILSSMKTIFTGILFRAFLGRELNVVQWAAIVLLSCGTATSQLPDCTTYQINSHSNSTVIGLGLAVVTCLLSAFGGIYSEKLLKDKFSQSIHWQNIQLYTWGIAFNFIGATVKDSGSMMEGGFFYGYNGFTWLVVLNNAINGLAISAILKYADNIARVYAHAAAMLTTMVLSIFLFGASPTPQLLIAIVIVSCSTFLYNQKLEVANAHGNKGILPMCPADKELLVPQR